MYTNVGAKSILISVNPYRWLPIYTKELMREHYEAFGTKELQPHVYAIAADAYKALCVHGDSQSIITSGESGAGKTENAKQIFRFLAEIAGSQSAPAEGEISMQQLLVHSNPVLEVGRCCHPSNAGPAFIRPESLDAPAEQPAADGIPGSQDPNSPGAQEPRSPKPRHRDTRLSGVGIPRGAGVWQREDCPQQQLLPFRQAGDGPFRRLRTRCLVRTRDARIARTRHPLIITRLVPTRLIPLVAGQDYRLEHAQLLARAAARDGRTCGRAQLPHLLPADVWP